MEVWEESVNPFSDFWQEGNYNSKRDGMVRRAHLTFLRGWERGFRGKRLGLVGAGFKPAPTCQPLNRRRRRLLVTTDTELMAMARAARAGFRVQPHRG